MSTTTMSTNGGIRDFVDAPDTEDHLTWALDGAIELALLAGMSRAKLASILAEEISGVLDPLVAPAGGTSVGSLPALRGPAGSERQAELESALATEE